MGFMVRHWTETAKLTDAIRLDALERVVPYELIRGSAEAAAVPTQRRRKLPAEVMVLLCVAMSLFTHDALDVVLHKLVHGLRLFWPDPDIPLATTGALCQARYRLGARPLVALFHQVCWPRATPQTPGAFRFGLRLMALDGTVEDVPDSPANVRAFGRPDSGRGQSAFPQVQGVYLSECGTHAVIDAGFWPCHTSERVGALRLLRSVGAGMLLLWDRGFYSFEMIAQTLARGAQVLGRVPATVTLTPRWLLPDGSYWAYISPSDPQRRKRGDHLLVRVIVYTLTDPARPGYGATHRLVTTLLDAQEAPALALVCAYHERWEIELTIDEIDTHQRLVQHPLRSQKPGGVIQELYGLLRVLEKLGVGSMVELIRIAIDDFHLVTPAQHPVLYQRLLRALARCRLPERARRTNPRVVKRKMSNFALKRAAPSAPSQRLAPFCAIVGILPQAQPASADLDAPAVVDDQLDSGCLVPCLI